MTEYLFLALIVLAVAGFIFWNTRRSSSVSVASPAVVTVAATEGECPAETGVSRYLRTLPPPPVETGVTKYIRRLPKPPVETGVAKYLKNLKAPSKPETGVSQYINKVVTAQVARASLITLEQLIESIPAPTSESRVARYLKTIG